MPVYKRDSDYTLLAVLPGGAYQIAGWGIVEAHVVLNNWQHTDYYEPTLLASLTAEAHKMAAWALHHKHIECDGQWLACSATDNPKITIRLEAVSYERLNHYRCATRH